MARRPALRTAAVLFAATLVWSCAVPGARRSVEPEPSYVRAARSTLPPWTGTPLSWDKLETIEGWLASEDAELSSFWRLEGELQLAEGRLELARRDLGAVSLPADHPRVAAARHGFRLVESDVLATDAQRRRAEAGLAALGASTASARTGERGIDSVIPRTEWGARRAVPARMDRTSGSYRRVTVHHSALADPAPLSGALADSAFAVREIQRAHMVGQQYGDIGYHFLIDPYGNVFQGRELEWQGAHAGGSNNVQNLGVCLIGNFDVETPTPAALDALEDLLGELRARYGISARDVQPHSAYKNTACPGRHLARWVADYRRR